MAGRRAPAVCNSFKKSWELCIAPGLARSASPNWWGQISFGSSTEKRLQTLACFTFSLYLLLPLIGWCWLAMFLLLINPLTLPFALAYLNFIFFFDSSPVDGKRGTFLRGSGAEGNWWRRYCDYFPMTIVKTAPLPATNKYVLGYHPHGVISVGAFGAFATYGARTLDLTLGEHSSRADRRGIDSLFPGLSLRLLTLSVNFYVPFAREYLLHLGACDASKKSFQRILAKGPGSGVVIVPGGAEESMIVEQGSISLVLEKRKGFVREAILAGAHLVPVLAWGENDLYQVSRPDPKSMSAILQRAVYEWSGVGLPFFNGRSLIFKEIGLMPRRRPIFVVVGVPLAPPTNSASLRAGSPELKAATNELHAQYVLALRNLYEQHKDAHWNVPSLKRVGTLKVL